MISVLSYGPASADLVTARGLAVVGEHAALLATDASENLVGLIEWCDQPFETEHLGYPVVQLVKIAAWSELETPTILDSLLARCFDQLRDEGVALVSHRLHETDISERQALDRAGFSIVESLMTLARPISPQPPKGPLASLVRAGEEEACVALAGSVFEHDRFHMDPQIDDSAADRLKAQWIRNACDGRAEAVLVAREGNRVVGFNACMRRGSAAVIDLIGVAPDARGKGHGRALVDGALAHYAGRAEEMVVGTQSSNHESLTLYHSCGFRVRETAFTFHAHL